MTSGPIDGSPGLPGSDTNGLSSHLSVLKTEGFVSRIGPTSLRLEPLYIKVRKAIEIYQIENLSGISHLK